MDSFIKLFAVIDGNNTETISAVELQDYVDKNGLDSGMVNRWLDLFDSEKTGIITLGRFCEVLGIKLADVRKEMEKTKAIQSQPTTDYNIICENMSDARKEEVIEKLRSVIKGSLDFEKQATALKEYLDKHFGRSWNVIITPESFWMSIAAIAGNSLHVDMNNMRYLIWKIADIN